MRLDDFCCTKCGECCRHIDAVEGLRHLQKDGVCKYLVGNICSIYDNRPDLCRRDKVFQMFKDEFSEEEFTRIIVAICNELRRLVNEK